MNTQILPPKWLPFIITLCFACSVTNTIFVNGFTVVPRTTPNPIVPSSNSIFQLHESSTTTTPSGPIGGTYTLDGKPIRQGLEPLGNYMLVKLKDKLQATLGGILLPDQSKERPTEGVVIESGYGKYHPNTAIRITNPIQKGMSVVFGQYDGRPVEYNGEECQMIRDDNVLLAYSGSVTMRLDNVFPVRDYVLIELDDPTAAGKGGNNSAGITTASGVVLAATVLKDQVPCQGKVIMVGEGRMASTGQLTTSPVTIGDMVKFKDYAGNDVTIEGNAYSVVKMVDILCTYKGIE